MNMGKTDISILKSNRKHQFRKQLRLACVIKNENILLPAPLRPRMVGTLIKHLPFLH